WRRSHPIPPDRTRWSRYAELVAQDLARERSLVEAAVRAPSTPAEQRIGAHFAACMDQPAIESRGWAPLREVIEAIDRADTPARPRDVIAELQEQIAPVGFALYATPDPRDARRQIATLDVGALGLEDPDDYARDDAASARLRERYRGHVERVLQLTSDREPAGDAARVV